MERVASRYVGRRGRSFVDSDEVVSDGMLELGGAVSFWDEHPELARDEEVAREAFLVRRLRLRMIDGLRVRNGRRQERQAFERGMERLDREAGGESGYRFAGGDDAAIGEVDVSDLLDRLPGRERDVVRRSVLEGETCADIGLDLGLTEPTVVRLRRRALDRLRYPADAPAEALSAREVEVLERVADGLSNSEIGGELHIGEETIKSHLRHILSKLDARTRTHAVAVGFRRGFLS